MLKLVKKKVKYLVLLVWLQPFVSTAVENKIPTPEFNTFTADIFAARLAKANLVTKTDFDNKLISLNKKINSNKTKHILVQTQLKN